MFRLCSDLVLSGPMVPLRSQSGFSLVELSIVLVILGLLVGGVLSGQALIRAAELRAVTSEYNRWVTATQTFRDKYFALPGDMPNATAFWGTVGNGGTGTCGNSSTVSNIGSGTETCDGNGDGNIGTRLEPGEAFRFWQHLSNAGLIEGNYAGVGDDSSGDGLIVDPAIHSIRPQLPIPRIDVGGAWAIWSHVHTPNTFDVPNETNIYKHSFMLDRDPVTPRGIGHNVTGIISPEEMWNIDTKIDDGKPAQGFLHSAFGGTIGSTACYTTSDYANAEYALSISRRVCMLRFVTGL